MTGESQTDRICPRFKPHLLDRVISKELFQIGEFVSPESIEGLLCVVLKGFLPSHHAFRAGCSRYSDRLVVGCKCRVDKVNHSPEDGPSCVFWVVNQTDGRGRLASNVIEIRGMFIDLDDEDTAAQTIEEAKQWDFPPHVIVESSPGKRHAYWRVNGVPLDKFKDGQVKLARIFGSDRVS